jgi:hypothetical protein
MRRTSNSRRVRSTRSRSFPRLTGGHVDTEASDLQRLGLRRIALAPCERAHAEEELARAVGLDDVIVDAGLEGSDAIVLGALRGEHDEERSARRDVAADRLRELEPADVREREIEDHDLRTRRARDREARRAARSRLHVVTGAGERARQRRPDGGVAVDDENTGHPQHTEAVPSRANAPCATSP